MLQGFDESSEWGIGERVSRWGWPDESRVSAPCERLWRQGRQTKIEEAALLGTSIQSRQKLHFTSATGTSRTRILTDIIYRVVQ